MRDQWIPIPSELNLGEYRVLFEGGGEGIAALTPRGWQMIEDTIARDPNANIVAYKKYFRKKQEEKPNLFAIPERKKVYIDWSKDDGV